MSRTTRRNLLKNLNSISNASIETNVSISGADFSSQAQCFTQAEEDVLFDIKMRAHGYVLTPAGWFPAHMLRDPVVEQRRNFISEVPGKRGKSNLVAFSVLHPYVERSSSCDVIHVKESPESIQVEFSLIKPGVLQVDKLAFEIGFILSVERVINELIYPVHDVFRRDTAPSYPIIQMPMLLGRVCSKSEIDLLLQIGCVEINPGPPKKKNNYKKKKKKNGSTPSSSGTIWKTPTSRSFPDCIRMKLRYIIPLTQLTGGGTTNSFKFTSNAYDVDSALGSTAMAGFAEAAAVYSRFRTLAMRHGINIENQEAFPAQIICGYSTTSLGSTAVGANYAGNPYMNEGMLTAINGSHSIHHYRGGVAISKLFGDRGAYYDDLYTGSTTSSTLSSSRTAYLYIGSVAAAVPVNGQFVSGWVELDVLFDRRNALIV